MAQGEEGTTHNNKTSNSYSIGNTLTLGKCKERNCHSHDALGKPGLNVH